MSWKLKEGWAKPRIWAGSWWKEIFVFAEMASENNSRLREQNIQSTLLSFTFNILESLQSLLQRCFRKYSGLIISPIFMISLFFQLNKVHCYINMSYFSSGEFVHPFSLWESIQTWKPQADFMQWFCFEGGKTADPRASSSCSSKNLIPCFKSLELFFFWVSVCICHCTKKLGCILFKPAGPGEAWNSVCAMVGVWRHPRVPVPCLSLALSVGKGTKWEPLEEAWFLSSWNRLLKMSFCWDYKGSFG